MNHSALCYILSILCVLTSSVYPAERAPNPTKQQSLIGMASAGATRMISRSVQDDQHGRTSLHRAVAKGQAIGDCWQLLEWMLMQQKVIPGMR